MGSALVFSFLLALVSPLLCECQSVGKLRSEADEAIATGKIDAGIKLLSKVIELEPSNERNYYKRYRANLRNRKYKDAYSDLSSALRVNPKYKTALGKRLELGLQLGRCFEAQEDIDLLRAFDPKAPELKKGEVIQLCIRLLGEAADAEQGLDWLTAREKLGEALQLADYSHDLLLHRAHANLNMGDYIESVADSGRAIKLESDSIPALEIRGRAYYYLNEPEMAMNHWRQALKFDPEHPAVKGLYRQLKKIQKFQKSADSLLGLGEWRDAVEEWRKAMQVDPAHRALQAHTLTRISETYIKQGEFELAIRTAEECVRMDHPEHRNTAQRMIGEALLGAERYEESVRAFEQYVHMSENSNEAKEWLHKAQVALKQSKEVDHYKVLGVRRTATVREVKKAYKEKALKHHPDKVAAEERDQAEQEFMKIAQAYEILSDAEMRAKYDRGEDVTGNQQGGGPGMHHMHNQRQHFTFRFH